MEPRQRRDGVVRLLGHGGLYLFVRADEEGVKEGAREPAGADVGYSEVDVCAGYGDDDGDGDRGRSGV